MIKPIPFLLVTLFVLVVVIIIPVVYFPAGPPTMYYVVVAIPLVIWRFVNGRKSDGSETRSEFSSTAAQACGLFFFYAVFNSTIHGFKASVLMHDTVVPIFYISITLLPFLLGRFIARRKTNP